MTSPTLVVVHRDQQTLAAAAAARFLTTVTDLQSAGAVPHVVLTGGGLGTRVLSELRSSPARAAVDWSRLHVWWGDERHLPTGHPDRNETQAREALLDHVDVAPDHVHPVPAPDSPGDPSPEEAAAAYAAELAAHRRPGDAVDVPRFDVLLLGMGPDGHVASLFPEHPALHADGTVTGVRGSPKPPPERVSMTFGAIRAAVEVWFVVAGDDKAAPAAMALQGAGERQVPAAGAHGTRRTLWLLDRGAATRVPAAVTRIASP
ncbi:6-phosphogluconolactonase [Aquipuribacter nitratireducens]|uniref:6-phosphogluconolactonase n=1 Tax=Aquipuribacter nitratireducens TaxID=650104 RepID=A0ABW0GI42_9MICO